MGKSVANLQPSQDPLIRGIEKELPQGSQERKRFDQICKSGSNPRILFGFLEVIAHSQKRHLLQGVLPHRKEPASVWDVHRVSRSEFKKLPKNLESLANQIDSMQPILKV